MNVTTEQATVALEKLVDLGQSWGTYCLKSEEHSSRPVRFMAWDGENAAGICAQCLAELVNEGADDGWLSVDKPERPENGAGAVWIVQQYSDGSRNVYPAYYDSDIDGFLYTDGVKPDEWGHVTHWRHRETKRSLPELPESH